LGIFSSRLTAIFFFNHHQNRGIEAFSQKYTALSSDSQLCEGEGFHRI